MRVIEQAAQAARRAFYLSQLKCDPHPWDSEPQSLRDDWIAAVKAALRVVDYRLVDPRDIRELLDGGTVPTTPDIGMGFDDVSVCQIGGKDTRFVPTPYTGPAFGTPHLPEDDVEPDASPISDDCRVGLHNKCRLVGCDCFCHRTPTR